MCPWLCRKARGRYAHTCAAVNVQLAPAETPGASDGDARVLGIRTVVVDRAVVEGVGRVVGVDPAVAIFPPGESLVNSGV